MRRDDPVGAVIGHFRIVRELGRGGMGIVYEGEDEQLHRRVALKILPPEMTGNRERRERFLREARSAARIAHPNIAAVYEIGEAGERLYIAMECVPGGSLRQRLRAGAIEVPEVRLLAGGIAAALAKAHQAGIVHRDLRPENVLLTDEGHVKLLDFGIAKALRPAGSNSPCRATGSAT